MVICLISYENWSKSVLSCAGAEDGGFLQSETVIIAQLI